MVSLYRCLSVLTASVGACAGGTAIAQENDPPPLPRGDVSAAPIVPEIVIEPTPSFSNLKLKLSRTRTRSDVDAGVNFGETIELQLLQPFKSSDSGAHVAEQGLGSVRSAQLKATLWRTPLLNPEEPVEARAHPVTGLQLLGTVGHRSFTAGAGRVHRVPFAIATQLEHRPGDPRSFLGRQKFGLGFQYRRQYLPAKETRAPVRVRSTLVHGSIEGAFGNVPLLANGLSYRVTAGYDLSRKIPGAELTLSTALFDYPRLLVGINFWVQGRDEDARTRDKRFDLGPRLSIQF